MYNYMYRYLSTTYVLLREKKFHKIKCARAEQNPLYYQYLLFKISEIMKKSAHYLLLVTKDTNTRNLFSKPHKETIGLIFNNQHFAMLIYSSHVGQELWTMNHELAVSVLYLACTIFGAKFSTGQRGYD